MDECYKVDSLKCIRIINDFNKRFSEILFNFLVNFIVKS
mgnify:CR=1 FL=1